MDKKYESRGADLLAGWDFTDSWATNNATIDNATTFTADANNGYIRRTYLTAGKQYKLKIAGTISTGILEIYSGLTGTVDRFYISATSPFNTVLSFTANGTQLAFLAATSGAVVNITSMQLYPVTIMDLSGNGHDASIFPGAGGFTTGPDGRVNSAYDFDGLLTKMETALVSNARFQNGFTIEAVINPASEGEGIEGNTGRIIDKTDLSAGTINGFAFSTVSSGRLQMRIGNALSNSSNDAYTAGVYVHVLALVAADGTTSYFINNTLFGTPGDAGNLADITTSNPLTIGNRSTATDRAFDGPIALVNVYDAVYGQDWVSHRYKKFQQSLQRGHFKGLL